MNHSPVHTTKDMVHDIVHDMRTVDVLLPDGSLDFAAMRKMGAKLYKYGEALLLKASLEGKEL